MAGSSAAGPLINPRYFTPEIEFIPGHLEAMKFPFVIFFFFNAFSSKLNEQDYGNESGVISVVYLEGQAR